MTMDDSLSFEEKKLHLQTAAKIYLKRVEAKQKKGESTHGLQTALIDEFKARGLVFVTRQRLAYHIGKLEKETEKKEAKKKQRGQSVVTFGAVSPSELRVVDGDCMSAVSSLTAGTPRTPASADATTSSGRRVGRPSKADLDKIDEYEARRKAAITDASVEFDALKWVHEARSRKVDDRLPHRRLAQIIANHEEKHGLKPNTIKEGTVRSRRIRGNVTGKRSSTTTPMEGLEDYILFYVVELARIGSPCKREQVLRLANAIIEANPDDKKKVIKWKEIHVKNWKYKGEGHPVIERGWYTAFMKRHKKDISRARGMTPQDAKRQTWITYENFVNMYDCVYRRLVEAGLAVRLDADKYFDVNGEECDESEAFGLPTQYKLTFPDMFIMVDEVGCNTNQKDDGTVGGERFVMPTDGTGRDLRGATTDMHFTCLGFTTAAGKPLMCAVIMKAKGPIPVSWELGIDPALELQDADTEEELVRCNKDAMVGGPTCTYKGKEVPCFVTYSPKASITSDILTEMLKRMDDLKLFEHCPAQRPFLLLDGHHSRLELPFLEYITNEFHRWHVCIGVPYGTHIWQLADSTEQNGCFKMALTMLKRTIMSSRDIKTFYATDIIPLVKKAWVKSFARVESNKKAICARGWGPLNRALLLNPSVASTRVTVSEERAPQSTGNDTLTCSEHSAIIPKKLPMNSLIEELHREQAKQYGATKKAAAERKRRRNQKDLRDSLRKATSESYFTSTKLAARGEYSLNAEGLADGIREKKERELTEAGERARKRRHTDRSKRSELAAALEKLRANNMDPKQLTVSEIKLLVAHLPGKGALKTRRDDVLAQYTNRLQAANGNIPPLPPPIPPSPGPDPTTVTNMTPL